MSSKDNFYSMIKTAGAVVTIMRPSNGKYKSVYLGGSGTTRQYSITGDDSQEGEDGVISVNDLIGSGLGSPQKGDRITDSDGDIFAVSYVRKMYGTGRELLGWRIRMIG